MLVTAVMELARTNKVLIKRLFTAAILLPIVVFSTLLLDSMLFRIILALVVAIAVWEYCSLINIKQPAPRLLYAFALALLGFILVSMDSWLMPLIIVSSVWWLLNTYWVSCYPKLTSLWHGRQGVRLLNGFFIFVPMFLALAALQKNNSELVLLLLALVWSADSGAYFAGKAFGSKKLCPHVSPGKTIEGLIGGIAASIVAMLVYLQLYIKSISAEQYLIYVVLSVVISIASVVGDLFESLHKRLANTKDSGSLLPGHGGLFDRIDGLTSAAPVFYLMYYGVLL